METVVGVSGGQAVSLVRLRAKVTAQKKTTAKKDRRIYYFRSSRRLLGYFSGVTILQIRCRIQAGIMKLRRSLALT